MTAEVVQRESVGLAGPGAILPSNSVVEVGVLEIRRDEGGVVGEGRPCLEPKEEVAEGKALMMLGDWSRRLYWDSVKRLGGG